MLIGSVIIIVFLLLFKSVTYVHAVYTKRASPTLSAWLIWLCATGLSSVSYVLAKKRELLSGIIVIGDVVLVATIVLSILLWGERHLRFRSHEKWYVLGCAAVIVYGLTTGNAFTSHLFSQGIIAAGYLPTYHTLAKETRRTEPYFPWLVTLLTAGVGFIPAFLGHDFLAVAYAARGGLQTLIVLVLMLWSDLRVRKVIAGHG